MLCEKISGIQNLKYFYKITKNFEVKEYFEVKNTLEHDNNMSTVYRNVVIERN